MEKLQGDAVKVGGMLVSVIDENTRVQFDAREALGAMPKLERSDVALLINFLQRVHGIMR